MHKGLSNKWKVLRKRAEAMATRLTVDIGLGDLPIALNQITQKQNTDVMFQPLLIEGGIALVEGGFRIYVSTPREQVGLMRDNFQNPEDGGRSFPSRIRFTVAHELAHTFFFDTMGHDQLPKEVAIGHHPSETNSLERECDRAAGMMLVPRHLLELLLREERVDVLNPLIIRTLASRFAVSIECLVIQMQPFILKDSRAGGVLVLESVDSSYRVRTYALTSLAHPFFARFRAIPRFDAITSTLPSTWDADGIARCETNVPCMHGGRQAIQPVEVMVYTRKGSGSLIQTVVGFHFVGPPQLVSEVTA